MAADIATFVEGLNAYMRMLRALPRTVQAEVQRELAVAASPLVERMRANAPRSARNKKSGEHLADSIRVVLRARGIFVGSLRPYGAIVEFAHHATQRSRAGTLYTRALHPTPWAYPALDEAGEDVRARLAPAIERAVEIALAGVGL